MRCLQLLISSSGLSLTYRIVLYFLEHVPNTVAKYLYSEPDFEISKHNFSGTEKEVYQQRNCRIFQNVSISQAMTKNLWNTTHFIKQREKCAKIF